MPLPLAFAFSSMAMADKMHHARHASRPILLRRVYFARLAVYGAIVAMCAPCAFIDSLSVGRDKAPLAVSETTSMTRDTTRRTSVEGAFAHTRYALCAEHARGVWRRWILS